MGISNILMNDFSQYFNTLQEAQQVLKGMEAQYDYLLSKMSATIPGGPSFTGENKLAAYEQELTNLMGILMSNQEVESDDFRQKVDSLFLSIQSTSVAYAQILDVLLEVQRRLEEEMKFHIDKVRKNREDESLREQADKARLNLEEVSTLIHKLKEDKNYEIQKDLGQIQDYLIKLRERYNMNVNPNQNIDKAKFNKIV